MTASDSNPLENRPVVSQSSAPTADTSDSAASRTTELDPIVADLENLTIHNRDVMTYLYKNFFQRTVGNVMRKGESQLTGELIYEKVLAKLPKALMRYNSTHPFENWFFGIVRNTLREFKRQDITSGDIETAPPPSDFTFDDLEREWERNERLRALAELIPKLSKECQQTLWYRFMEDKTHEEIAEIKSIKDGTQRVHSKRCMDKLDEHLQKKYGWLFD